MFNDAWKHQKTTPLIVALLLVIVLFVKLTAVQVELKVIDEIDALANMNASVIAMNLSSYG